MKKFFLLTAVVCLCCYVSIAQQEGDSSSQEGVSFGDGASVFSNFSYTVKDYNKILLQWNPGNSFPDSTGGSGYFIVEKSEDGNTYETFGAIKNAGNVNQYEFTNNTSATGHNFYRIKYQGQSGQSYYSKPLQISTQGEVAIKFYPNPVDKLLIVETDHKADMQLINSLGTIRLSSNLHQGVQVIDVSTLEPGAYILHIVDNDRKRNILQQLVKK
jgi:Secretion system C-terminal sorting domain